MLSVAVQLQAKTSARGDAESGDTARISLIASALRRIHNIVKKRLLASSCLSVRLSVRHSAWNDSAPSGRIFTKFGIWVFFENIFIVVFFKGCAVA